jgi:hypothetical protein
MANSEPIEPGESERRDKINRRLVIFGVVVVVLSFAWHIGSAFLFGVQLD